MIIGDWVIVVDDNPTIVYEIVEINNNLATIVGINYRIKRDIGVEKLLIAPQDSVDNESREERNIYMQMVTGYRNDKKNYLLGTILHCDGDQKYLDKCLSLYKELGIFAYGVCLNEDEMELYIDQILNQITPDIIVLTGHDLYNNQGLSNLGNYKNSKNFINTINKIRKKKNHFECCIIAGACQSNYEALIAAGADFASSPKRINIHTYDPAVIAIKVASTSFVKVVNFNAVLKHIKGGREAFGGIETLGKMKLLM